MHQGTVIRNQQKSLGVNVESAAGGKPLAL